MYITLWIITKATDTFSYYVIITAFPLQKCLHERASKLRSHTLRVFSLKIVVSVADEWNMSVYISGKLVTENNRSTEKTACPIACLSAANFAWTDLESDSILCGERPATKHLSHDVEVDMKWKRVSKRTIKLYGLDCTLSIGCFDWLFWRHSFSAWITVLNLRSSWSHIMSYS